jgi:pyruvate/2-oxoglutarate dehydrogenase complex dihydrolipoamide acyltransferase (E2) component
MFVSSYQIHNVLSVYSKQLSQDRGVQKQKAGNKKPLSDQINLSTEGKRRATIEKVAKDILNRISHYGSHNEIKASKLDRPRENLKDHFESDNKKETTFVFNVIDDLNKKTTTALSVKDKSFLMNRLEQLGKDAVEKDADI